MPTTTFCTECGAQGILRGGSVELSCGHGKQFYVPLTNKETRNWLDKYPYLYNCSTCGAKVKVNKQGEVKRTCSHTTTINAPRKVILTGDGTLNGVPPSMRISWHFRRFLTWATGRCI